eukprot:g62000.t1
MGHKLFHNHYEELSTTNATSFGIVVSLRLMEKHEIKVRGFCRLHVMSYTSDLSQTTKSGNGRQEQATGQPVFPIYRGIAQRQTRLQLGNFLFAVRIVSNLHRKRSD